LDADREITKQEGESKAKKLGIPYIEISSVSGFNVNEPIKMAIDIILEDRKPKGEKEKEQKKKLEEDKKKKEIRRRKKKRKKKNKKRKD